MPSTEPATKGDATYQDVMDAPEHLIAEIMGGELILSPRPASPHAYASSNLVELLGPIKAGRRGSGGGGGGQKWWIIGEPELHLGADVLVPDLAGWRTSSMSIPPRVPYFVQTPDWVCEVLSPSTARRDRLHKLALYATHGVEWAWLCDPSERSVQVFRRHEDAWLYLGGAGGDSIVHLEPFEELELDLFALWLPDSPADAPE